MLFFMRPSLTPDALRDELVSSILNPIDLGQFSRLYTRREYFWHALSHRPSHMKDRLGDNLFGAFRETLREDPLRVLRDALFGNIRFDYMRSQLRLLQVSIIYKESDVLISVLREHELREEQSLVILDMLSEFHYDGLVLLKRHVRKICLAILSHQAPRWNQRSPLALLLINTVVSFAAICCSPNEVYQKKTLTNCDQSPWLFLNLRNTDLSRE